MEQEPTTTDILEAIQDFSAQVDKKFTHIDERFDKIETDIVKMKSDITSIKSTMVTKEYLDEKLADLRGDMTVLIRKEDTKLKALVDLLTHRQVITEEDKKNILSLEPFAQLSL